MWMRCYWISVPYTFLFVDRANAVRGNCSIGRNDNKIKRWVIFACAHNRKAIFGRHVIRAESSAMHTGDCLGLLLSRNGAEAESMWHLGFGDRSDKRTCHCNGYIFCLAETISFQK